MGVRRRSLSLSLSTDPLFDFIQEAHVGSEEKGGLAPSLRRDELINNEELHHCYCSVPLAGLRRPTAAAVNGPPECRPMAAAEAPPRLSVPSLLPGRDSLSVAARSARPEGGDSAEGKQ